MNLVNMFYEGPYDLYMYFLLKFCLGHEYLPPNMHLLFTSYPDVLTDI